MSCFIPQGHFDRSCLPEVQGLLQGKKIALLTGAGVSTASGIPDYRGPVTATKKRSPILYQEFVADPEARRRYWARSAAGWPMMRAAEPNHGHRAIAKMEKRGRITGLITQNVDSLHSAAGSSHLVELHGSLAKVRCLDCGLRFCRDLIQDWILSHNPGWEKACQGAQIAPDGDMEVPQIPSDFAVPTCASCAGVLKPDVVFFGENVPRHRVDQAWQILDEAQVLLIAGSSLTVYSGLRFVRGAKDRNLPIIMINIGPTRADPLIDLKIQGPCCEVLTTLAQF